MLIVPKRSTFAILEPAGSLTSYLVTKPIYYSVPNYTPCSFFSSLLSFSMIPMAHDLHMDLCKIYYTEMVMRIFEASVAYAGMKHT